MDGEFPQLIIPVGESSGRKPLQVYIHLGVYHTWLQIKNGNATMNLLKKQSVSS
jgi:hypothetical protein